MSLYLLCPLVLPFKLIFVLVLVPDFVSYAYLYHQKQMLTDRVRMNAYHDAIKLNADVFKDKVVLDVGAGR